ncbi:hypothetical protein ASC87_02750 [Rhizobacter sp. Root1221]|nr:hypothetical protein ASC87_02750 [Rhizobacter sp. Root1221]
MVTRRQVHETLPVRLRAKDSLAGAPLVRIALLDIDPAQLAAYRAAVSEEIDDSIRLEPGVLSISAPALKDQPHQLRFFEIYADAAACRRHLDSAHFRKCVDITRPMIASRRLLETTPLFLSLRPR